MTVRSLHLIGQVLKLRDWTIDELQRSLHEAQARVGAARSRHDSLAGELERLHDELRRTRARGQPLQVDRLALAQRHLLRAAATCEAARDRLAEAQALSDAVRDELAQRVAERRVLQRASDRLEAELDAADRRQTQRESDEHHAGRRREEHHVVR